MLESIVRDLHHAMRLLARSPGFSLTAVTVLALGVGVNTTIFSAVNAALLKPLPVADADRLVRVYSNTFSNTPYPDYLDYRERTRAVETLAAFQPETFSLRMGGEAEPVFGELVTDNYFSTLGVGAALGRTLLAGTDREADRAVVLSHRYWERRFGGDPTVVGRQVVLNGQVFTVVGVASSSFTGVSAPLVPALWVPVALAPALLGDPDILTNRGRGGRSVQMIGRLRDGVGRTAAQTDLATINAQLQQAFPETNQGRGVTVYTARTLHPELLVPVAGFAGFLLLVAGLVLVITCLNLATLLLTRAAGRRREIGVRLALGAGRARVVRQLLTESLLLAAGGTGVGLVLTWWASRLLQRLELPLPVPVWLDFGLDGRVLIFAAGVSVVATVQFGLAPTLHASRLDLVSALKTHDRGHAPRASRLLSGLVVAQIALSLLLLVTDGLFLRSLANAQRADLGFDQDRVLAVAFDLAVQGVNADAGRRLQRQLTERVRQLPGVAAASFVEIVPLTLSNRAGTVLREGQAPPATGRLPGFPSVNENVIDPGHFDVLGIPLLTGRDFTVRDGPGTPAVVIVNETMADRYWPDESPIGKRIRPWGVNLPDAPYAEVIGLVRDSKYVTVGEMPRAFVYRPLAQHYAPAATLLVRTDREPLGALAAVRQAVSAVDADLPVFDIRPLAELTSVSLLPARLVGWLLGLFGVLALVLAAIGLYGVVGFLARQRTHELGIRLTLGAQQHQILATVLGPGLRWTGWGLAIGLGLSLLLTRLLSGLLHEVSPSDPLTYLGVSLLLAVVALAAAFLPARRAVRLQPMETLRSE